MLNVLLEEREIEQPEIEPVKERYNWRYENSINHGKKLEIDGDYSQWRTNSILSNYKELILIVNELNIHFNVTDKMHYDYLHAVIRKEKRWSKPETKEEKKQREREDKLLSLVCDYYKYNVARGKEALKILTTEQINIIEKGKEKGGIK